MLNALLRDFGRGYRWNSPPRPDLIDYRAHFSRSSYEDYGNWYSPRVARAWTDLVTGFSRRIGGVLEHTMRLEDVEQLMEDHDFPRNVRPSIMSVLKASGLLPGKRGTGVYTKEQIYIFDDLRTALAQGKPCVVGSNDIVGTRPGVSRMLPGVTGPSKGLLKSHVYTIVRSFEMSGRRAPLKFITMKNTSECYGRQYAWTSEDQMSAREASLQGPWWIGGSAHEMHIELSDYTKRFSWTLIGPRPPYPSPVTRPASGVPSREGSRHESRHGSRHDAPHGSRHRA